MAILDKDARTELSKCIICRDQIRSGRVCNACYDAMRFGKKFRVKKS